MNPQKLIKNSAKELRVFMQENLEDIAASMISAIMVKYRKLPVASKINATKNLAYTGQGKYKTNLREAFSIVSRDGIDTAKENVPAKIQFAEYDKLPAKIRRQMDAKSLNFVGAQVADLQKQVFFEFNHKVDVVDAVALEKNMIVTADNYIKGPVITTGAKQAAGAIVNESRQAYFNEQDVADKIQAYQYINVVPNAAICVDLQNKILDANDPALATLQPPFHFNCDGYWLAILKSTKKEVETEKFVPSKKAQSSIQFAECCSCFDMQFYLIAHKFSEIQNPIFENIQSIIVSKEMAPDLKAAESVVQKLEAKHFDAIERDESFRFRQKNPSDFVKGTFRSFQIKEKGVTIIYGKLK